MDIDGKVLITGATRGIGRAVMQRVVDSGARVIGLARRPPEEEFPGDFYACDLLDAAATAHTLAEIVAGHEIAGLVNNAGVNYPERLGEVDLARFDDIIAVNIRAAIQCAQAVVPGMRSRATAGHDDQDQDRHRSRDHKGTDQLEDAVDDEIRQGGRPEARSGEALMSRQRA